MASADSIPVAANCDFIVSRAVDGPRQLVFEAFTDPAHLARWWGPNGFTTTTRSFEFRPGGVWDFITHGPDGTDYPNWIEWREIVPPERLVYLHGESDGDSRAFAATVTLVEQGSATVVTMHAVFKTKEQFDEVVERYGVIEGGRQHLGRLATHIATLVASRKGG